MIKYSLVFGTEATFGQNFKSPTHEKLKRGWRACSSHILLGRLGAIRIPRVGNEAQAMQGYLAVQEDAHVEQSLFLHELADGVTAGIRRGPAVRSRQVHKSIQAYWELFVKSTGLRADCLGGDLRGESLNVVQAQEEKTLLLFLWYIAKFPRKFSKKKSKEGNSVQYALSVVATVRAAAERDVGRQVGTAGSSTKRDAQTRAVVATLAREGPMMKEARRPILRSHLERVKRVLNLEGSGLDRVGWAVTLSLWFAALRVGDLLGDEVPGELWDPSRRTHRGRLTVVASGMTERGLAKLVLVLKPTKTDQSGKRHIRRVFTASQRLTELSAGTAVLRMIQHDDEEGDPDMIPLFRNPETGKELTPADFNLWWKMSLRAAGLEELAKGGHAIRIGACSTMTELEGLDGAVEAIGWRLRETGEKYAHVSDDSRIRVQLLMARGPEPCLAQDSVPISRY